MLPDGFRSRSPRRCALGETAELAHAPIEAQLHYRRALDLWPNVDDAEQIAGVDRRWLLEHAAEVASLAGSHHGAMQLADQLLDELDPEVEPERHARILDRRALYSWHGGDLTTSKRAAAALREGVESGVTLAAVTRPCGVAYQAALELRYLDALALARDALAAARQMGGRAEVSYALHVLGSLEGHLGRYDEGIDRLQESLALAIQGDDAERVGSTWHNLVEAHVFAGRTVEAVDLAERGLAELERRGLRRTYAALTTGQLTLALLALGRWERGRRGQRRRCSPAMSTRTSRCPSASAVSTCSSAKVARCAEALLADLVTTFRCVRLHRRCLRRLGSGVGNLETRLVTSADRPRSCREITASTDEIMLELRLTALALRLHADEYDLARTTVSPRDVSEARRVADGRLQRAEAFLERIEHAVDGRSGPFHQTLRAGSGGAQQARRPASP